MKKRNAGVIVLIIILFAVIIAMMVYILVQNTREQSRPQIIDGVNNELNQKSNVKNVNLFKLDITKCLNKEKKPEAISYGSLGANKWGLNISIDNKNVYLYLDENSFVWKESAAADLQYGKNEKVLIKGIDGSKVVKVLMESQRTDMEFPHIVFLMDDGAAYIIHAPKVFWNAETQATLVTGATELINIEKFAIPSGTYRGGIYIVGIRADGSFYIFS